MSEFQRLLYVCDYPPCDLAGAPVIMKQLLKAYPADRLRVCCDREWHESAKARASGSLLPVEHSTFASRWKWKLRPHRIFHQIRSLLDLTRVRAIEAACCIAIREQRIRVILAPLYSWEFAAGAYLAAQKQDIALIVWESDNWPESARHTPLPWYLIRRWHTKILRSAAKVYATSPAMIRHHQREHSIESKFLFNFLDAIPSTSEAPSRVEGGQWRIIYTGALNAMFTDALEWICSILNEGLRVSGKHVVLEIYGPMRVTSIEGPNVVYKGFVKHSEVRALLGSADILLLPISFDPPESIRKMTLTSLYTKTIDYLAAQRPVLIVGPSYTAENDYFGEVCETVDSKNVGRLRLALERLLGDCEYANAKSKAGLKLLADNHGPMARQALITEISDFGVASKFR